MRQIFIVVLVVSLVVAFVTPSSAQLINWKKRGPQPATPATPPARITPATPPVTTGYMEVTGMVIKIDKKNNQITVRDENDNSTKDFMIVDARILDSLTTYKRVVVSFRKGSSVAAFVKVLK